MPGHNSVGVAERSYPMSEVRGCCRKDLPPSEVRAAAERSYPTSEVSGGGQEELPHV